MFSDAEQTLFGLCSVTFVGEKEGKRPIQAPEGHCCIVSHLVLDVLIVVLWRRLSQHRSIVFLSDFFHLLLVTQIRTGFFPSA